MGVGELELFGKEFTRTFKGHGSYKGRVTDYNRGTVRARRARARCAHSGPEGACACAQGYHVEYEDGDAEDLSYAQLVRLLNAKGAVKNGAKSGAKSGAKAPAAPPPEVQPYKPRLGASVRLDDFVKSARSAARWKRKHTEMKRSGLLERQRLAKEAAAAARAAKYIEMTRERVPLHKPPAWASELNPREGRLVKFDADFAPPSDLSDADTSLYRLEISPSDPHELRWWFPSGNGGDGGAWIGMYPAACVYWLDECGEVTSGAAKVAWKMLGRNAKHGTLRFPKMPPKAVDGEYVYTLQARAT